MKHLNFFLFGHGYFLSGGDVQHIEHRSKSGGHPSLSEKIEGTLYLGLFRKDALSYLMQLGYVSLCFMAVIKRHKPPFPWTSLGGEQWLQGLSNFSDFVRSSFLQVPNQTCLEDI